MWRVWIPASSYTIFTVWVPWASTWLTIGQYHQLTLHRQKILIVAVKGVFVDPQSLSADLAATKMETHTTRNDILHRQNVSEGRDKYKTLKQIRQGNTKQRVDMFEAMWNPVLVRKQQRWWRVFRRCGTAIDCRESQIKSSALFSFRSSFRLPFNLERWKLWTLNSVVEEGLVYFCFLSSTTSNADYSLVSVSFAFCFSWTQDVSQILISQRSCCRILLIQCQSISEYGR